MSVRFERDDSAGIDPARATHRRHVSDDGGTITALDHHHGGRRERRTGERMDGIDLETRLAIEQAELQERQRTARREANDRAEADRDARLKAAQDAQAEQRRQAEEATLMDRLRNAYFLGSPSATEDDWTAAAPKVRELWMLSQANRDPVAEEAAALMDRAGEFRGTW